MPQYSIGTVTLTNSSSIVTGSGVDWSGYLTGAAMFWLPDSDATFLVAQVRPPNLNASGKWEISLTAPFVGASGTTGSYVLSNSFSPIYGIPLINRGDAGGGQIYTRGVLMIEALLSDLDQTVVQNGLKFLPNIGSLAGLAALSTGGVETKSIRVFLDTGTQTLRFFQLQSGTDATDLPNGVARPGDYDPQINTRVWQDVLPAAQDDERVPRAFSKVVPRPSAGGVYTVGLDFARLGSFEGPNFQAVLKCEDTGVIIEPNTNAHRNGHTTGWKLEFPGTPGQGTTPPLGAPNYGGGDGTQPPAAITLVAVLTGDGWQPANPAPTPPDDGGTWTDLVQVYDGQDLGDAATRDVGTSPGTVAAGDDARFPFPNLLLPQASREIWFAADPVQGGNGSRNRPYSGDAATFSNIVNNLDHAAVIHLLAGLYSLRNITPRVSVEVLGAGMGSTIIQRDTAPFNGGPWFGNFLLGGGGGNGGPVNLGRVVIADLTYDGRMNEPGVSANPQGYAALCYLYVLQAIAERVEILHCGATYQEGFPLAFGSLGVGSSSDYRVASCRILDSLHTNHGCTAVCMGHGDTGGAPSTYIDTLRGIIEDCRSIRGGAWGAAGFANWTVRGCYSDQTGSPFNELNADTGTQANFLIEKNYFLGNSFPFNARIGSINLGGGPIKNVTIRDNYFLGNPSPFYRCGIHLQGGVGPVQITDNEFQVRPSSGLAPVVALIADNYSNYQVRFENNRGFTDCKTFIHDNSNDPSSGTYSDLMDSVKAPPALPYAPLPKVQEVTAASGVVLVQPNVTRVVLRTPLTGSLTLSLPHSASLLYLLGQALEIIDPGSAGGYSSVTYPLYAQRSIGGGINGITTPVALLTGNGVRKLYRNANADGSGYGAGYISDALPGLNRVNRFAQSIEIASRVPSTTAPLTFFSNTGNYTEPVFGVGLNYQAAFGIRSNNTFQVYNALSVGPNGDVLVLPYRVGRSYNNGVAFNAAGEVLFGTGGFDAETFTTVYGGFGSYGLKTSSVLATLPGTPTGEYTLAGLPNPAAYSGKKTSVFNPAAGKSYTVRSDGTNWRYEDQSIAA